ncbi:MAG: hypothetical protein SynsKO_45230 [Synoicihabitans sp.]
MRATLLALNEELLRLKAAGVTTVNVSDDSIRTLRQLSGAKNPVAPTQPAEPASRQPRTLSEVPRIDRKPTPSVRVEAPTPKLPEAPKVELPEGDKQTQWDALVAMVQHDEVCQRFLRPGKKIAVGTGDLDAKIFFCGEAPGAEEEIKGEPFVGPAGQLLDKMIKGMGVERSQVYIGNIMNWRPQIPTEEGREQIGNRPPTAEEITYCLPYLRAQLAIVKPAVIVALGATAAKGLLGYDKFKTLGEVRSNWHEFSDVPVMVTYHPSYILRNQSQRSKRAIWEDLLQVMEKVALPISDKQRGYFQARS